MKPQTIASFRPVHYLAVTQNWKANLENFDSESKFLRLLFEDYFVNFLSPFFTSQLHEMESKLTSLEQRSTSIKKQVNAQLLMLEKVVDDKVKEKDDDLKKNQVMLETAVNCFFKEFVELKNNIYQLAESASACHERFSSPCISKLV